jgi:hypothetical protein
MQITLTRLDIPRTKASWPDTEFNPAYVASRQLRDGQNWWVADTPVSTTGIGVAVGWAIANTDEYIRIPLFSYSIVPQGDLSFAFMFQLGVIAANAFNGKAKSMHMVVGMPVELTYTAAGTPESINYWFGFALA